MERLGLGWATLRRAHPRLIYCSVSAFHPATRLGDRPGYDLLISGVSGLQSMTGEPGRAPLRPGINLVDLSAGTNAALGILLAVIARQRTGRGQKVDVSLMDSAVALMGQLAAIYLNTGTVPTRRPPEDLHAQIVPYGTFVTADDRYLNVCVPNNKFWVAFCEAIDEPGLGDDARFATNADRIARRGELIPHLAARFRQGSRDHWIERLLARGIPAGPVHTLDEVVKDGYLDEAGMLARMSHPVCGPIVTPGIPIRLSATPGAVRAAPPTLGQHTDALLGARPVRAPRARRAARTPARTRTRSRTR
jgi:crotonobetainyl-CoA:carnitine CoA-transferase CaiB-like acyl-CoA transferase